MMNLTRILILLKRDYATEQKNIYLYEISSEKQKSYIITQNCFKLFKSLLWIWFVSSTDRHRMSLREEWNFPVSSFVFKFDNQQLQKNPNDIQKNLHSHCIHNPKKNLGNFCKLYTRDNWFDWNETKIWGNIEKWERAKVRSVDKQQIDWTITHYTLNK